MSTIPMTPADPFGWVGATIDQKYRVEAVVGEGGFGVVYRAHHLTLDTTVAIKVLRLPEMLTTADQERFFQSFLAEGRLMHRLSKATSAIVQALDVNAARSPFGIWTPYLVLEWLDGRTLEDELNARGQIGSRAVPIAQAMSWIDAAAHALQIAHEQGIAHRDVKPANLFLCQIGSRQAMKVLDFGIAKVMTETVLARAFAATGAVSRAFSITYGAPEQFDPRLGATGPWTDVYALALVFVEVVTGRAAYEGTETPQLYLQAIARDRRPTPRSLGYASSDEVERVLERALAVDPRLRFPTAGPFWTELRSAVMRSAATTPISNEVRRTPPFLEVAAAAPSPVTEVVPPPAQATSIPTVAPIRTTPSRSHTARWVALGMLGIVIALGVVLVRQVLSGGSPLGQHASSGSSSGSTAEGAASSKLRREGMVLVKAGEATIGIRKTDDLNPNDEELRTAHIQAFFLDRTEVTTRVFKECVAAGACDHTEQVMIGLENRDGCNEYDPKKGEHPINCVDRVNARKYCEFRFKRLPTGDEWQYAARGTEPRKYPWGDSPPSCELAIYGRGGVKDPLCGGLGFGTAPVGTTTGTSPFGAEDMAGNVWEWSDEDVFVNGESRGALHGGGWDFPSDRLAVYRRLLWSPTTTANGIGFRCAADVED